MSEKCENCVEKRLLTGCNCFEADEITDEDRQELALADSRYDSMYEFVQEHMLVEEFSDDMAAEVDFHEYM